MSGNQALPTQSLFDTTFGPEPPELTRSVCRVVLAYSTGTDREGLARVLGGQPVALERGGSGLLDPNDGRLSRAHAVLEPSEPAASGWQLRDLGSRNGTWLNGRRIDGSASLTAGDVIRVGDQLLLFQKLHEREVQSLLGEVVGAEALPGVSPQITMLRARLAKLADSNAPVLITGQTGVGKDLVARALHGMRAAPAERPFVAINCAAFGKELQEGELFGHVKGAFTGAATARRGLIREADGGTLFLDELGEMPLDLQAKLLRVLESFEVRPVGSDQSHKVEVRIVAATNRDLEHERAAGRFRSDLFARLMTHGVDVPPLAARKDDLIPLFKRFAKELGEPPVTLSADVAEVLLCHDWPLNVRELRQLVVRLSLELSGARIQVADLPLALTQKHEPQARATRVESPAPSGIPLALLEIRRDQTPNEAELRAVYAAYEGNVSRMAAFFCKERVQIYRWLKRFGLSEP